jgi:hypothetical protein
MVSSVKSCVILVELGMDCLQNKLLFLLNTMSYSNLFKVVHGDMLLTLLWIQIGRPVVFALACDGEAGVKKALKMLRDEFELAMALAGCTKVKDINRSHVQTESERLAVSSRL